ncbi:proposed homoserine kinase [Desulfurispirillum indicum S5]|uniref:Proposed homoserine kinase n=1 Tax=Desulfurispirillum indicum (strain ATCC BAA-1389 / DSM 22839 / S5) TaxID=653733 RepID=E6W298_DESIS|nr:cofactor-independent phosphoglycerate mutase [Desulfurispirillum indicum]ADU65556.1 proposed homoserine kinase [Desulfurispirillum indicum S5]
MKHVVFLGDGMSDHPLTALNGKTALQVARTPHMDAMVASGIGGSTLNAPDHLPVGSDICNLGVLGYRLDTGYTGRSPIEAAAMGVELSDTDVAFRCNLVSLKEDNGVMDDFSAGHISTEEACRYIQYLKQHLQNEQFSFFPGVSYRHLVVWHGGMERMVTTPPHDISDQAIAPHLPHGEGAEPVRTLMERSMEILRDCPLNQERARLGKIPVSAIWLWGQGKRPSFQRFTDLYGKRGAMITAVDLMRGVANCIGFRNIHVEGATGWIDTNYEGKAQACIEALADVDLVYIHVESPDESGHAGKLQFKIQAIEDFDAKVVGPVMAHLQSRYHDSFRAVALPDHPTPVEVRTHTRDRVPFAMTGARITPDPCTSYDESLLQCGSVHLHDSTQLMKMLLAIDEQKGS